jgi:hypothetical protein
MEYQQRLPTICIVNGYKSLKPKLFSFKLSLCLTENIVVLNATNHTGNVVCNLEEKTK